jgi:hypothetical protein
MKNLLTNKKIFITILASIVLVILFLIFFSPDGSEDYNRTYVIDSKNKIYTLSHSWLYNHNDIPAADIDADKNWTPIGSRKLKVMEEAENPQGVFWVKNNIIIKNTGSSYGISIPYHYTGAQFYFNGILIYKTSDLSNQKYPPLAGKPNVIKIPLTIVRGVNTLSIRMSDLDNFNEFFKEIKIGDFNKLFKIWVLSLIWYGSLAAICF